MPLNTTQIEAITRQVLKQFPEMKGAAPAQQVQASAKTIGAETGRVVLTYRGRSQGPEGRAILRIVRVVADDRGKVLKISTSR